LLGNFIVHSGAKAKNIQINVIDVDNIYHIPLLPQKILRLINIKRLKYKLGLDEFPVTQAEVDLFLMKLDKHINE